MTKMIPSDEQIEQMMKSLHKAQFVYIEDGVLWYRVYWLDKHPDGIQFLNDFLFPVTQEWITKNKKKLWTTESVPVLKVPIEQYVHRLRHEEVGKKWISTLK